MKLVALLCLGAVLCGVTSAYSSAECPTLLKEWERTDCFDPGDPDINESTCQAKTGCIWCESSTYGVPWCFSNTKPGEYADGTCPVNPASRVDCYQNDGTPVTNLNCANYGCVYCPTTTAGVPWCFQHPDNDICPTTQVPEAERVDCHPDSGATKYFCEAKGCKWCKSTQKDDKFPWCYYDPATKGYTLIQESSTSTGYEIQLQRDSSPQSYSTPVDQVTVTVEFRGDEQLRVKIADSADARFKVADYVEINGTPKAPTNPLYEITFSYTPRFSFKITRKSTGATVFDTSLGGFVFEDQFIQINSKLPAGSKLYGLGETEHHSLKHNYTEWRKYSMFARDNPPWGDINIYGTQPYFTVLDSNNDAYGVLLLNSNAMEVDVAPHPYITMRTIGGILDFYFFLGPTPENVVQQYTSAVGRPYFPPYWSLGFQLCRYGYNSIGTLQETVSRMRNYKIPFDVQYGDIDYMDQERDFTYDKVNYNGLPEYVDQLHAWGMKYIIILDPCIDSTVSNYPAFDTGTGLWITKGDGTTPAPAKVWPPGRCYFPDYTKAATEAWWTTECVNFKNVLDYDGLWIDMNEPANFVKGYHDTAELVDACPNNKYDNPPYKPRTHGEALAEKTLCMEAQQTWGKHYDVHSLYGYSQSVQTVPALRAATGKRGIVISRSTFPGSGKYAGHWLGDNWSQWSNLHYSIIGCLEFNMFGIPYIGPDICGFGDPAEEEMCQRWQQLGAFYTFSRNHNAINQPEQDPAFFGPDVAASSREALEIRYQLLPYLYTLFHHANVNGDTVMRPLFHEFTDDVTTHDIDRQFLWGSAFLISPVLDQGNTSVKAYFPSAKWYAWESGAALPESNTWVNLTAPLDFIPLHIRGGYILPMQDHAVTTTESRLNNMGLIVALDETGYAEGDLFWDDGDSIDTYENGLYLKLSFMADAGFLTVTVNHNGYSAASSLNWGTIKVWGIQTCNGITVRIKGAVHSQFTCDGGNKVLEINNIYQSITDASFTVSWA